LLSQLNPVTGAIDVLIGEAADKGNTVLQQQLEHLRGSLRRRFSILTKLQRKRGEQLDESASGECRVVAAKAPPTANETVELLNSAKRHVETDTNSRCQR
jgi:hypothetical protein